MEYVVYGLYYMIQTEKFSLNKNLKDIYWLAWSILNKDGVFFKEMKIETNNKIKIRPKNIPIIYVNRDLLPEFVYIMHNLHVKILKNILDWSPKEIEIINIDIDKNFDEILLGIKVALEPIFALALFYNSKYVNESEKSKFFTSYTKFVNKLAVKVNKIIDILEINRVDGDVLQDFIKEIKKIRCENENLL